MAEKPGADEMYCRSCGEIIKEEAEICPHCGVRNSSSSSNNNSKNYETNVSENWWYGVAAGIAGWIALFVYLSIIPDQGSSLAGFAILGIWALTPIAIYFDSLYVRANSDWTPSPVLWALAMAVWLLNIPAGITYLIRRHQELGEP